MHTIVKDLLRALIDVSYKQFEQVFHVLQVEIRNFDNRHL